MTLVAKHSQLSKNDFIITELYNYTSHELFYQLTLLVFFTYFLHFTFFSFHVECIVILNLRRQLCLNKVYNS